MPRRLCFSHPNPRPTHGHSVPHRRADVDPVAQPDTHCVTDADRHTYTHLYAIAHAYAYADAQPYTQPDCYTRTCPRAGDQGH